MAVVGVGGGGGGGATKWNPYKFFHQSFGVSSGGRFFFLGVLLSLAVWSDRGRLLWSGGCGHWRGSSLHPLSARGLCHLDGTVSLLFRDVPYDHMRCNILHFKNITVEFVRLFPNV